MKKTALLLCGALAFAGAAFASPATAPLKASTKSTASAKPATAKTHVVEAEVVSADAMAKTLTIKGEPNKTMPVDASAAAHLSSLKAGEKVKLTCRDNDKGEHEAITHITVENRMAKASAKK